MESIKTVGELYIALGAGGLCVVAFIVSYFMVLKQIKLAIDKMMRDTAVQNEVIKNNSEAIKEFSRSNDNVAAAIETINNTVQVFTGTLNKHDARSEDIEKVVGKLDERTKACLARRG